MSIPCPPPNANVQGTAGSPSPPCQDWAPLLVMPPDPDFQRGPASHPQPVRSGLTTPQTLPRSGSSNTGRGPSPASPEPVPCRCQRLDAATGIGC